MISSLTTSLMRVTLFWYVAGILVMFFGHPDWAEAAYLRVLNLFPWLPEMELDGLDTAIKVQWALLTCWTMPVVVVWISAMLIGAALSEVKCQLALRGQMRNLKPSGEFGGVKIDHRSLGPLPRATTPALEGSRISLTKADAKRGEGFVELKGAVASAVKLLTPAERQLCEELLQLLSSKPNHYAGLGHGVGLLAHTLNVVSLAAAQCTSEFRLPLVGALAHDVGKLVTFVPDGEGGWKRKGLHSRESARILATLPGFRELPELHQDALLLAVKYDHNPSKMPELRGNREASMLALRIITALSLADRTATAEEKDRHLERLQPEDLLFKDFCSFLREAPIATRGKKGTANMVNNPPENDYIFIYEAAWREAAVRRLPPEVAAALDLNRRDSGKLAKYTRILAERLRSEGLLLEQHNEMSTTTMNPLWDIQSGTGEKSVVFRGVIALRADPLWAKLNYRLSVKSPFPVTILAPNADAAGKVNSAPSADTSMGGGVPEVNDGMKLDMSSPDALATVGLVSDAAAGPTRNPRTRSRAAFKSEAPSPVDDSTFGFAPAPAKKPQPAPAEPAPASAPVPEPIVSESVSVETVPAEPGAPVAPDVPASTASDEGQLVSLNVAEPAASGVTSPPDRAAPSDKHGKAKEKTRAEPAADAPVAAPAKPKTAPVELSRTEARAGLAIADAEAIAKFPHLKVGDKFYTDAALEVQKGTFAAGRKYKETGNLFELSEKGPRRAARRFN